MVQWVRALHLPCKCEVLSSNPQNPQKSGTCGMRLCNISMNLAGRVKRTPESPQASQPGMCGSKTTETVSNKVEGEDDTHSCPLFAGTLSCGICAYIHTQVSIYNLYTHTKRKRGRIHLPCLFSNYSEYNVTQTE